MWRKHLSLVVALAGCGGADPGQWAGVLANRRPSPRTKRAQATPRPLRQVLVFMGQSNMAGQGSPITDQAVTFPNREKAWLYGNDGLVHNPPLEPVDTSQDQVYPESSDLVNGTGPMLATADAFAWTTGRETGIVPCPLGGSSADEWQPTQPLYLECRARWLALPADTRVVAFLVYQGETDAQAGFGAGQWAVKWRATITHARESVGLAPVVVVQLPPTNPNPSKYPDWSVVRAQQSVLCDELAVCTVVAAPDGPYKPDGIHLETAAQLELGQTMAAALVP